MQQACAPSLTQRTTITGIREIQLFSRELLLKLNKGIDDKRYKDDIAS